MIPHLSRRTRLAYAERDIEALKDSLKRTTARLHAAEVQRDAAYRSEQDMHEKLEAACIVIATEMSLRAKAEAERDALADLHRIDGRCANRATCLAMVSKAEGLDHLLAEQSAAANGFSPDWAPQEGDAA